MTDKIIHIDHTNLNKYLKDTAPYIFVDTADIIPGKSGKGQKLFANNEWFFKCHFENNPLVPAVFQLESIMQTAALTIYTLDDPNIDFVYAQKFMDFEVKKPVYPGQIMEIETNIISYKRGIIKAEGNAYIKEGNHTTLSCSAKFTMIVPGVLNKFSPTIRSSKNVRE